MVWNDSTPACLARQARLLAGQLRNHYGLNHLSDPLPEAVATEPAPAPEVKVPKELWIDELNAAPFHELLERAEALNVKINPEKTRHHIVFDLLRALAARGTELFADGIIELGAARERLSPLAALQFQARSRRTSSSRRRWSGSFFLRNGNRLTARIRPPRDRERFMTVDRILNIEGIPVEEWKETTEFEKLTALHPNERIVLENPRSRSITTARHRPHFAARPRPARAHRRAAAHRQDRHAQGDRAGDPRQCARDRASFCCSSTSARRRSPISAAPSPAAEIYSSTFDESPQRHTSARRAGERPRQAPRRARPARRHPARFHHPPLARLQQPAAEQGPHHARAASTPRR